MTTQTLSQIFRTQVENIKDALAGSQRFITYLDKRQPLSALSNESIVHLIELVSAQFFLFEALFKIHDKLRTKPTSSDEILGLVDEFKDIGLSVQASYQELFAFIDCRCKDRIHDILEACKAETKFLFLKNTGATFH